MDKDMLQLLARRGAEARLRELRAEVAMLEGLLETPKVSTLPKESQVSNDAAPRRRRRHMSAAAKAAISKRMKAYWATQRQ